MDMRTRLPTLFLLLGWLSCLLVHRVHSLNPDAGSWVRPTQGEPWPSPTNRMVRNAFHLLRPSTFQFNVIGGACDIMTDAVERYKAIILTEARIAKISSQGHPKFPVRDDATIKGTLSALDIRVTMPCEMDGNHWPHLEMSESCKLRGRRITKIRTLVHHIRKIWRSLPESYAQKLVESMPKRCQAIIANGGDWTPYYALVINENSTVANLVGVSIWGVLRGLETFSQLLIPAGNGSHLKIRCQTIQDAPKFPHRGLLLDTSRHYLPISDIMLTLDAMSYNKMNVLHWHIVDDNSFPYQSSSYPELSAKGAYHPSMVYTLNDIQTIVDYARLRGIRVMPEFDTPGHTRSWGLAHPELLTTCYDNEGKANGKLGPMNPTSPQLYEFLSRLFAEIVQVFPDQYVHLGGDEVPFDCWMSNPVINSYMKSHNMSSYTQLESEYIGKLLHITNSLQASTIVWQEVFENGVVMPNSTVVHVWTGQWTKKLENATRAGHPVLLSACWYLDHIAGGGDWKKFYKCDPLSFATASSNLTKLMLGGEACMWGEFVDRNNVHSRIWPRASAAAERLWSSTKPDEYKAAQRLEEHACRMNRRGIPAQPPNGPGFCVM